MGTLAVAGLLGAAAGCSGAAQADTARLRALEDTGLAGVEVPGATQVETFRKAGDEYTTIHGVHTISDTHLTRRFASDDLDGTARTLAAALEHDGWVVYAASCAPPGGSGSSSSVTAAKQFDGFVARAEVVVVHPSRDAPYTDLTMVAPNSRSEPESAVRRSWDTFDEACAQTFGVPAGPPPQCDRWCDRIPPTTTSTTTARPRTTTAK